jgi:hypothetical protein
VVFAATMAGAAEQAARTNEELARELMVLTGAGDLGRQVMGQMVEAFRQSNPEIPAEFWDELMASADADELIEMGVAVHVKHLTRAELEAAIAFYSSPEGRSLVAKLPVVMQESMAAGQAWGEKLGREIAERLDLYQRTGQIPEIGDRAQAGDNSKDQ